MSICSMGILRECLASICSLLLLECLVSLLHERIVGVPGVRLLPGSGLVLVEVVQVVVVVWVVLVSDPPHPPWHLQGHSD